MNNFVNFNKPTGSLPSSIKNSTGIFSRVMSAGSKISTTTIIIILAILLFIILAIYYYYYHVLPKLKTSYNANSEYNKDSSESGNKQAEMLLFYAEWCPHCKTAKPNWDSIKSQYQNKTINGYHVIFTEVNCTTESAETEQMMNKYNIEGFPTIKLIKDGQVVEFDAKPTRETLHEFLNTVL